MPLTNILIKNIKSKPKPFKLFDSGGLYLLVTPKGNKWWRLKYYYQNKELLLSLGVYSAISLKEARNRRDEAKGLLAKGINPGEQRKKKKP